MLKQRFLSVFLGFCFLIIITIAVKVDMISGESLKPNEQEIVKRFQVKREKIETLKVDVTVVRQISMVSITITQSAVLKRPGKMKMEQSFLSPMGDAQTSLVVSDGNYTWMYMPSFNKVTKTDLNRLRKEEGEEAPKDIGVIPAQPFIGIKKGTVRYVKTEKLDGKVAYLFEGTPLELAPKAPPGVQLPPMAPLVKVKVWIGVNDSLLYKKVTYDKEGAEAVSETYKYLEVNGSIDDSQFSFIPPDDATVMDNTDEMIRNMKTMKAKEKASKQKKK